MSQSERIPDTRPDVVSGMLADSMLRDKGRFPTQEERLAQTHMVRRLLLRVGGEPLSILETCKSECLEPPGGPRSERVVEVSYGETATPGFFWGHIVRACGPYGELHLNDQQNPERVVQVRALLRGAIVENIIDTTFAGLRAQYIQT